MTKRQHDKKTERQKDKMTKMRKGKKTKRQDKIMEFIIMISGQFRTLAMFYLVKPFLWSHFTFLAFIKVPDLEFVKSFH